VVAKLIHHPVEVAISLRKVVPYSFTVKAYDGHGCSTERAYTINETIPGAQVQLIHLPVEVAFKNPNPSTGNSPDF
jgi:hypothetical protein